MSVDTHSSRQGRPYSRLHVLIVVMTVVALGIGALALHYLETRLVSATGENLALAAAEITDKLDRLLFERYGDTLMMARAFPSRVHDPVYLNEYLNWVKTAYAPVYLWLGVTDAQGRIVTATDSALVGLDYGQSVWFQRVRDGSKVHVGDVGPYEVVNGMEAVAFTAPILGAQGEFLGVITTRLGIPMLEAVLTRTIREMESREGFSGHIEYQILTQNGDVFIDADLLHKGRVNLKRIGLPSAVRSLLGEPGYVEEEHLRRHVFVVTGYAQTKGYGEFQGLRWSVLFRQDRDDILRPIHGTLWKVGLAGAVVWLPMLGLLFWATSRLQGQYRQAQQESACARAAEA
ncbi:MAG: cache domain-containing protein, partial [Nitrospiraceae bacterium]